MTRRSPKRAKSTESLTVYSGAGDIYRQCRFFYEWIEND